MDRPDVGFPSTETVTTALLLATRAPSIHNSQPWRWRVGESSLDLFADPRLQLRNVDPDGRDLLLSCGAALQHCLVALAALGWQAKVHRLPDPSDSNHLARIELYPRAAEQVDVALAAAIPRRRTDRRHYSCWPVGRGDVALMGARAARFGVMLRQVDALDKLNAVVARAVFEHVTSYDYLSELTSWSGRRGSVAGVPARNTPVCDENAPLPGRLFAGPALAQPPDASPANDAAVMLALGTAADDRLARLRAGEATGAVLLTATSLGLASCPVTEPLEIVETREMVRCDVFGTSGYPQMLLRVGWAPINADPLPPTPRRDLGDTVEWMKADDHNFERTVTDCHAAREVFA